MVNKSANKLLSFCYILLISQSYAMRPKLKHMQSVSHQLHPSARISLVINAASNPSASQTIQPHQQKQHFIEAPSYNTLLRFGLPTLGIWLLQPILSMIDTSVIGMSSKSASDIIELAAIGPGIAWIDCTAYLCQFIGIATTNLYAVALGGSNVTQPITVLSHASFLSVALGAVLTMVQYSQSASVIRLISGTSQEIVPFAILYSHIRSLASVVAIPSIIAQTAFLTQQDVITPLIAVLIGALVNIVGDIYFVCILHQGIRGAAIATTMSQIATFCYLAYRTLRNINKHPYPGTKSSSTGKFPSIEDTLPFIQIPNFQDVMRFASFSGPLFFVLLAKSFLWSFTTYACSTAGAPSLAAHQITINFFLFFAIFGDVASTMSQTFLPSILYNWQSIRKQLREGFSAENESNSCVSLETPSDSNNDTRPCANSQLEEYYKQSFLKTFKRVISISAFVGVINACLGYFLQTRGVSYFTRSNEIGNGMKSVSWLLAMCVIPHAIMASLEGVLVAGRDSYYHALSYLITGAIFLAYQEFVRVSGWGLIGVWRGFAGFQWLRLAVFVTRVWKQYL